MNKYLVEFIGTFFLVFAIGNVSLGGLDGNVAPLAIGATLMVMIYAGGHISGAHYNPAVTLAIFLRGKCEANDVAPYMVVQIVAAAAAAYLAIFLQGATEKPPMELDIAKAIAAEIAFTFALAFVILNVATAARTSGNSFYGVAIGFTVVAGAYTVGAVSGGVFNPAVAVGVSLMKLQAWSNIWVFLVANFVGGALAAVVFKIVNPPDAP
ncbi:MAG: porin [Planctomycetota bacterium]|nr:MAG: porin [Planctomycetota bacterium]REJ98766.1 MAG: porin [Planctomycetota bacterium]REK28012.1 MAG: porin [Planctomycetota bacterium]REK47187.1 MAG: porin [Planctomycetota bacterium]